MGYLGLDQTVVKDDNLFQRLFWPSDHAGETDYLGKQGFWVCWGVGIFSALVLTVQSHWIIALLTLATFALGGIGVREHSQPAATIVAAAYWLNQLAGIMMGVFPGVLALGAGVLLIANIRGTYIAAKWAAAGDPDVFPDRASASFTDRFVDQMPARVWPRGQIPFYVCAALYLLLSLLGLIMVITGAGRPRPAAVQTPPSATLEVSPSR